MDLALENPSNITAENVYTPKQIPLPKKLLGGFALTALILGAVLAKFAPPVWLNMAGLLLTGIAALVLWAIR
jgi:hypothetical protein